MPQAKNLPSISSSGPMDHSTLVGGSTADRRRGCAASWKEEQKVPAHIRNKSSSYADEGTGLHAAMQFIMEENIFEDMLETHVLDREFEGILITQKLLDTAIIPCMDYLDCLMDELKNEGDFVFETETRCAMPGIEGAFGTTDFIFRTAKRTGIVDYKFGEGVPVKAWYWDKDAQGEPVKRGNSQLLFYGRSAQHTIPHMFEDRPDWPVELHILQPRVRDGDGFSVFETNVAGLETFRAELIHAVDRLKAPNPKHTKGPWCTFASCKTVCPLYTGALVDLSKIAAIQAVAPERLDYDAHLALILELWELAEAAGKQALSHAQTHLENGGNIVDDEGNPAWKLVPKRAQEKVVDETGMVRHALGLGLSEDDVYAPREAKSPAQLGILLEPLMDKAEFTTKKARTEEARSQLAEFTVKASSGSTLARYDDRRPEVTPTPQLVAGYAAKLALLNK